MELARPKDLRRPALLAGSLLALACGHTEPFSAPPYGSGAPLDPAAPARLTYNERIDRDPAWLPDGSAFVYSTQPLGRTDDDLCLAELPGDGGSQRFLICDVAGSGTTTDALVAAAPAPDGRLAYARASGARGAVSPDRQAVAVAPALDPRAGTDLQPIPYSAAGAPRASAVRALRWLAADRLAFVASQVAYRVPCLGCVMDTIVTGLYVGLLDPGASDAGVSPVPGTELATGVAAGAGPDEILFTVAGDSRVYRKELGTGATDVLVDFGSGGIARDVHAAGGRLSAIVGGRVAVTADPELGTTQWDSGGIVHVVDLVTGADVALDGPGLFRRPALSPDGSRLVAEGYPLIIHQQVGGDEGIADTTVARVADLYLFRLP